MIKDSQRNVYYILLPKLRIGLTGLFSLSRASNKGYKNFAPTPSSLISNQDHSTYQHQTYNMYKNVYHYTGAQMTGQMTSASSPFLEILALLH